MSYNTLAHWNMSQLTGREITLTNMIETYSSELKHVRAAIKQRTLALAEQNFGAAEDFHGPALPMGREWDPDLDWGLQ